MERLNMDHPDLQQTFLTKKSKVSSTMLNLIGGIVLLNFILLCTMLAVTASAIYCLKQMDLTSLQELGVLLPEMKSALALVHKLCELYQC